MVSKKLLKLLRFFDLGVHMTVGRSAHTKALKYLVCRYLKHLGLRLPCEAGNMIFGCEDRKAVLARN